MVIIKVYFDLFKTFFKIGLFTFGGGYAMIGMVQEVVVKEKEWIMEEEMSELITISEATPGSLAVNIATFVGYKKAKTLGSFFTTLGVVLPSFFIIIIISIFLERFKQNTIINNALKGINAGVTVLVLLAFISLARGVKYSLLNLILTISASLLVIFTNINIILIMITVIIISLISYVVRGRIIND